VNLPRAAGGGSRNLIQESNMKTWLNWTLCALVLCFGISASTVQAEEDEGDESVCAGETIDELLDNAAGLVKEKKFEDAFLHCFSPNLVKSADADGKKMMVEVVSGDLFAKMLADCKGKGEIAADGKTAKCMNGPDLMASFELVDEEWYVSM
jgi:hypothetical protein